MAGSFITNLEAEIVTYIFKNNQTNDFNQWLIRNSPKKFKLDEFFTLMISNNAQKFLKDNTIKWFVLCLANEECQKYEWTKNHV
jgi:hypothetical protein